MVIIYWVLVNIVCGIAQLLYSTAALVDAAMDSILYLILIRFCMDVLGFFTRIERGWPSVEAAHESRRAGMSVSYW